MSLIDEEVARAEAKSVTSRARLASTFGALQTRLKPSALARDAIDELKEIGGDVAKVGVDAIKRHPVSVMGTIAALTAFFARKPLRRFLDRRSADT